MHGRVRSVYPSCRSDPEEIYESRRRRRAVQVNASLVRHGKHGGRRSIRVVRVEPCHLAVAVAGPASLRRQRLPVKAATSCSSHGHGVRPREAPVVHRVGCGAGPCSQTKETHKRNITSLDAVKTRSGSSTDQEKGIAQGQEKG